MCRDRFNSLGTFLSLGLTNCQNDLLQSKTVQQLTRVVKCVYKIVLMVISYFIVCIGKKKSSGKHLNISLTCKRKDNHQFILSLNWIIMWGFFAETVTFYMFEDIRLIGWVDFKSQLNILQPIKKMGNHYFLGL